MSSLIEEIVRIKNKVTKSIEEKHPHLSKFLWRFFAGKRYGYQFLDENGAVIEEYTLITNDHQIKGYEPGIKNVSLAVGMKKAFLEKKLKEIKTMEDDYVAYPISSYFRELPKYILHFIRRDIRFGIAKVNTG